MDSRRAFASPISVVALVIAPLIAGEVETTVETAPAPVEEAASAPAPADEAVELAPVQADLAVDAEAPVAETPAVGAPAVGTPAVGVAN